VACESIRVRDTEVLEFPGGKDRVLGELRLVLAEHGYSELSRKNYDLYARLWQRNSGPDDRLRIQVNAVEKEGQTNLIVTLNHYYVSPEVMELHGDQVIFAELRERLGGSPNPE